MSRDPSRGPEALLQGRRAPAGGQEALTGPARGSPLLDAGAPRSRGLGIGVRLRRGSSPTAPRGPEWGAGRWAGAGGITLSGLPGKLQPDASVPKASSVQIPRAAVA